MGDGEGRTGQNSKRSSDTAISSESGDLNFVKCVWYSFLPSPACYRRFRLNVKI